jgi:hypothetical protein
MKVRKDKTQEKKTLLSRTVQKQAQLSKPFQTTTGSEKILRVKKKKN